MNTFYEIFQFIKFISQEFLDKLNITEKDYFNFLLDYLKNCNNIECEFIKKNIDLINWVEEEELLEHINDYNLVLLPLEQNNLLNIKLVKFFLTSNLKEDIVAAFAFTNTGISFYIDIKENEYIDLRSSSNKLLVERKPKSWDEDYEIKSKIFILEKIKSAYIDGEGIDFLEMPNYTFLVSTYNKSINSYILGYDLNDINELYFSKFFYDLSKNRTKNYEILNFDFGEVIKF